MYEKLFELYVGDHTTLDLETATQIWIVYLKGKLVWINRLQEYVEKRKDKQTFKVHRDLWMMMLSFATQVKNLSTDYKQDEFWPIFIQQFVEFLR